MPDTNSMITLHRAAPAALGFKQEGLLLRVEVELGVAKLQIMGRTPEQRFLELFGWPSPPARSQREVRELTAAWLAPGEWLFCGPEAEVGEMLAQISEAHVDDAFAVDLTHARTSFLLEGVRTRDALSAHCPLDLWPTAFPVNGVARTLLADTSMFLARLGDNRDIPRFRIIVDQTMGSYAMRMLAGPPSRVGGDH